MANHPRLHLAGISKRFGVVRALEGVSLTVEPGEVHALLGENGAGKSTLLKILSGVLQPNEGTIEVDGQRIEPRGPVAARVAGIAMIHQELQQVPELTVAQNMFLGRPLTSAGGMLVSRGEQERRARQVLERLDPGIDPAAPIKTLKVAQRQIVEIARAVMEEAKIIAMDEPTSSLTPSEFDRLVLLIEQLVREGVSIIYVSHKMDEVFRLCRRATILRDGQLVDVLDLTEVGEAAVVARMVGRTLAAAVHHSHRTDDVMLSARNLTRGEHVIDASFDLHRGEVLGISGLIGAGRTELLRLLAGVDRPTSGNVIMEGAPLPGGDVRAAIEAGIGLLPEERKRDGIVPGRPITSNVGLPSLGRFSPAGMVRRRALRDETQEMMQRLDLRPLAIDRPIRNFSGGNQQKAIIGRWIMAGAKILLFDEPTRGIDVGAKAEIYNLIEALAAEGRGIIVVSSELPEILRLADRVLVMREGRISASLERDQLSEEAIVAHAIPQSRDPQASTTEPGSRAAQTS